ncbi:heme-dependent oxidative N-demethylase family protein [Anianabacter salinae]|uniref:heme-dependent oxidative N-demethylase family protein n=1 Tax=Anianabacter salinae TaxID=2851023 RepID=UPI00225E51D1|nr:DUF3445 domain-containing protein [Anianabacter salinae]MBV0912917.1 DUF3445 domain-containing protein [Anianabacter salinae]
MTQILQSRLPEGLWGDPRLGRLPGIQPVRDGEWLIVDDAFAAQMAERERLVAEARDKVIAALPGSEPACAELLEVVLEDLGRRPDFAVASERVTRPDGVEVAIHREDPLGSLARLVQEDLCLMEAQGDEHVLTAAVLCFPSSWTLAQKIGRPLTGIHTPVRVYDEDVARRVQRLFDGIRAGQPLWRVNVLPYDTAALFTPQREEARRPRPSEAAPFIRSERQSLIRLPVSGAVVFAIHTFVVQRLALREHEIEVLRRLRPEPWL